MSSADYVVVGAGSAGCVVAARLAEVPDARVVVLEAGPPDTLEAIHQPPMWPALWGTEVDWAYETVPQPANGGLVHQWPRGKVLGGAGSPHRMGYPPGHPPHHDDWGHHRRQGRGYDAPPPPLPRGGGGPRRGPPPP